MDPAMSEAYLGLAYVYHTPTQYRRAMEYARRFTALRPRAAEGHVMLARVYLDLRNHAAAAREAQMALRARPADGAAWHLLGLAQVGDNGGPDAMRALAAQSFARAVSIDPTY